MKHHTLSLLIKHTTLATLTITQSIELSTISTRFLYAEISHELLPFYKAHTLPGYHSTDTIQHPTHSSTMKYKRRGKGKPNGQQPQDTGHHCTVCKSRQFKTEQGLSDHFKCQHAIFPCSDCNEIYAAAVELAEHRYSAHNKGTFNKRYRVSPNNHLPTAKGNATSRPRAASSPAIPGFLSTTKVPVHLRLPPSRTRSASRA